VPRRERALDGDDAFRHALPPAEDELADDRGAFAERLRVERIADGVGVLEAPRAEARAGFDPLTAEPRRSATEHTRVEQLHPRLRCYAPRARFASRRPLRACGAGGMLNF